MPTIAVDKVELFKKLGKEWVLCDTAYRNCSKLSPLQIHHQGVRRAVLRLWSVAEEGSVLVAISDGTQGSSWMRTYVDQVQFVLDYELKQAQDNRQRATNRQWGTGGTATKDRNTRQPVSTSDT